MQSANQRAPAPPRDQSRGFSFPRLGLVLGIPAAILRHVVGREDGVEGGSGVGRLPG